MSATQAGGFQTPSIQFESIGPNGKPDGSGMKFVFLGEGESTPTLCNRDHFHGPGIVTRRRSASGMTESVDHYCDDPSVIASLIIWIGLVAKGRASIETVETDVDRDALKQYRDARSKFNALAEDLCAFCGENHHPED